MQKAQKIIEFKFKLIYFVWNLKDINSTFLKHKQSKMNKLLYFFILLILLNQSMSDDVTGCEGGTEDDCSTKTPSDSLYKCEMVKENEEEEAERKCTPVLKTCDEASALKDADCSQLTPANKIGVCFSGNEGCQIAEECGDVTSSATEQICQKFLSNDPTHKCSFIEADSDKSIVAHCESTVRGCTEEVTGVTPNSAICSSRTTDETFCYFNGQSSCKQATACGEIELSPETTKDLCSHYNTDSQYCVNEGNTCALRDLCKNAQITNGHDCSYYPVTNENNECALKDGSETECAEKPKSQTEPDPDPDTTDKCSGKTNDQCSLILEDQSLIQCEWDETNNACKTKVKYTTCSSAKTLAAATNAQCGVLSHAANAFCIKGANGCLEAASCEDAKGADIDENVCKQFTVPSYQECAKGTDGCKLNTKSCTDNSIRYEEGICDNLAVAINNAKCYYDGTGCVQATSCGTVAETSLTETALDNLCKKFNEETKNCVADGKKCKLEDKETTPGGDDDKENEKETGKDDDKENEKEGEGEGEGEGEKDETKDGKNSSSDLKFSLALLFLIFVI